jgi:hypothetical protein
MADRSYTTKKLLDGIYFNAEFGEVTVSQNDTFTLGNFSTTTNLSNVYIMKNVDGTEMTQTHAANNVVTVTGAGTNVLCVYMAYGVKA